MNREQIEAGLYKLGITPAGFTGEWVQARCPFAATRHERGSDRAPSFGVSIGTRSFYNCLACKSKGPFTDLPNELASMHGKDYTELSHEFLVSETSGMVLQAETYETLEELEPLNPSIYGDLFDPIQPDTDAARYVAERNCSLEAAAEAGVQDWPEEGRLMFPIRGFDRKLYGWTGRAYYADAKPKVWNMKGVDKSCHLLGAEHCTCDRPIVLVEGLMFYLRLWELQVQDELNVDVCAIMGSALSFEQADMLAQIGQPVILFLDNDKAGKEGTFGVEKKQKDGSKEWKDGAVQLLSRALRTHYVVYPNRVQDPDDLTDDEVFSLIEGAPVYARKRQRA